MAITNKQIISLYKAENGIPESTPLLTYGAWRERGYQVKRGEHARHKVTLYKHKSIKDADGQEAKSCMFLKTCCLFLPDQVEKI